MSQNTAVQPEEQTQDIQIDPALARSVCVNCAHLGDCTLRTEGAVIHFCEELEVRPKAAQPAFPREAEARTPIDPAEGLCATCAVREGCALRTRAEGGVWYCEEYE